MDRVSLPAIDLAAIAEILEKGGSAETLREYWTGEGHPGPSHGAYAKEIAWGTPGDFMRCVGLVKEHAGMSDEHAKGYCNLLHHRALGYWPAQHARMEKKAVSRPAGQQAETRYNSASGIAVISAAKMSLESRAAPVTEDQVTMLAKDFATAWEHELRDPHGRWTRDGGGAGTIPKPGRHAKPEGSEEAHSQAIHATVAEHARTMSSLYTDEQISKMQERLDELQAELHKEAHKEAKVALGIRMIAIVAAVAMAASTGGLSLLAVGPLFIDRLPEIGKELAEYVHSRRVHKPQSVPAAARRKSSASAQDDVISLISSKLAEGGLDADAARQIAISVISTISAGDSFPADDGLISDSAVEGIVSQAGNAVVKGLIAVSPRYLA